MGQGSWEEMVRNAVGDNTFLKEQLVEQLAMFNEVTEAVRWAELYQLSDDVIPAVVKEARHGVSVK